MNCINSIFMVYGKNYGISYSGGIAFPDNPYKITLDDFEFDVGDRFTYEYNFSENWLHDIRIEAILHADETATVKDIRSLIEVIKDIYHRRYAMSWKRKGSR
nr:hypothetical protein [Xenorhabdus miraniensis]